MIIFPKTRVPTRPTSLITHTITCYWHCALIGCNKFLIWIFTCMHH